VDLLTLIDVLNGSTEFSVWNNTAKPSNTSCPP
jgi:hypothetical protein